MTSAKLTNLIKDLSQIIIDAPNKFQQNQLNEEWTKFNLIVPLLEGLGWSRTWDLRFENRPVETEGFLDFLIMCQPPIGVEAKALVVNFPPDRNHSHVKKGLKQSKERGASYFIWTNGDCWQFYSLALPNAPIYQVILSSIGDGSDQAESIGNKLRIIEKEDFTNKPEIFDDTILNYWKVTALPAAWNLLLKKHKDNLTDLVRKGLPAELDIKSDEILDFLRTLKSSEDAPEHPRLRTKRPKKELSFPDDWKKLIESHEPIYEKPRKRFRDSFYSKFGEWIISDKYQPWHYTTTWRYAGLRDETKEKKKSGWVITLFKEWGFIEKMKIDNDKYVRVDEGVQYLKKLFEK